MNKPYGWVDELNTFVLDKDYRQLPKSLQNGMTPLYANKVPDGLIDPKSFYEGYENGKKSQRAKLEKGGCGNCHACLVGVMQNGFPVTSQRMILCPDCGNKRCPKASNHRHQCTGSNEPNQRGSIYTTPQTKPLSDEEITAIWQTDECYQKAQAFARAILRKAQESDKIESLGTVNIGGVHFRNGKEVK